VSEDDDDNGRSGTLILARPLEAAPRRAGNDACIILLHPPGPDIGRRTSLDAATSYVVGRETKADLVIPRDSVSRQHAQLVCDSGGNWWVQDLGSTNGTFINEEAVERRVLADGDQLRFGDAIFKFLSGSNIESAYHEEIYRMTILDGLTGVHNKRYFLEFLEREMASAHRHGHPLTLVMFDIDHFKPVNDERGHLAGDEVLKALCNRIRPRIRREDLFARYGGEEFAVVLNCTSLEGGVHFAEQVRAMVADQPFSFAGESFPITISLGLACMYIPIDRAPTWQVDDFIRQADENLYEAKRLGRNRCVPSPADLRPNSP
jgi:two-component system, cell cycle response regulator